MYVCLYACIYLQEQHYHPANVIIVASGEVSPNTSLKSSAPGLNPQTTPESKIQNPLDPKQGSLAPFSHPSGAGRLVRKDRRLDSRARLSPACLKKEGRESLRHIPSRTSDTTCSGFSCRSECISEPARVHCWPAALSQSCRVAGTHMLLFKSDGFHRRVSEHRACQ